MKSTSSTDTTTIEIDREHLALALRLAERFGFHEGICNHFSVRAAGPEELYLINPYGVHWSEIEPHSLLLINADGTVLDGDGVVEDTARFIHIAGHRANPRHKALFHTHMPYATTLTMLDGDAGRLAMAHQTATRFYNRIDYQQQFAGLALDAAEGERLANSAARAPHIDIIMLAQHGVVVGSPSIALAFDDLYYLERACRQQVLALQTGAPLKLLSRQVTEHTAQQFHPHLEDYAQQHFKALGRVLRHTPDRVLTF